MATSGAGNGLNVGTSGQISDPRQALDGGIEEADKLGKDPKAVEDKAAEEALVSKRWKKYEKARKFDENYRKQIAIDRRYAAGTSDNSWAVTTNIIGAYIDILVALLYARNPDVSVSKSPQTDDEKTAQIEVFARTMEIVISQLWKKGKLKKAARKGVRSVLSNAEGWLKCTMVSEKEPAPELDSALNDAKTTMEHLAAQQKLIEDPQTNDPQEMDELMTEKAALIESLQDKIEATVLKMFVIDFVPSENMQVSTDVTGIMDYLDADWIGNELFVEEDDALARCPRLTKEDLVKAKKYYQRAPKEMSTREIDSALPQGMATAEVSSTFSQSQGADDSVCFVRIVEIWDRVNKKIYTLVDGCTMWAKEPYAPPYPTSRFYPYFYFAFYEIDGLRHAQSLSWRLYKLQDEYSATRSNFRLTRERSIPGVLFNATMLDQTEAEKLQTAKHQEYTALRPADPTIPLANIFAAKPVAAIDMRVFDPSLILSDMERISGVQEALSAAISSPGNPKTATEANIQQSGTQARTNADRDSLESMLTEMAQYTAEQALQCLSIRDVQRMAGPKAFWPAGMSIDDLFTMVEIQIEAGTTGKPRAATDQQAWSTLLPLIKQTLQEIEQALAIGNTPMANALIELVKETMLRLGDESDVDRFIPRQPPPGSPGAGNVGPKPVQPQISVSLRGEITPAQAAALVAPAVAQDAAAAAPPPPAPGAAPPGASPAPGPQGPPPAPALTQPPR